MIYMYVCLPIIVRLCWYIKYIYYYIVSWVRNFFCAYTSTIRIYYYTSTYLPTYIYIYYYICVYLFTYVWCSAHGHGAGVLLHNIRRCAYIEYIIMGYGSIFDRLRLRLYNILILLYNYWYRRSTVYYYAIFRPQEWLNEISGSEIRSTN